MWCVSVLSSGLSTVSGEKCGLREREVKEMKSLTSSQVRQESDEPREIKQEETFPSTHTAAENRAGKQARLVW